MESVAVDIPWFCKSHLVLYSGDTLVVCNYTGEANDFLGAIQFICHKPHALRQINVKSAQCLLGTCFIDRTLCKHALGAKRGTPRGYVRRRARLRTKIPGGNLECAAIVVFLPAYGEGAHSLTFFQPKKISIAGRKPM